MTREQSIVQRLRGRLTTIPKPGTEPRFLRYGEVMHCLIGGSPKAGDDAGDWQLTSSALDPSAAGGFMVQSHVWATEPLCAEAAAEIEDLQRDREQLLDVLRTCVGFCPYCEGAGVTAHGTCDEDSWEETCEHCKPARDLYERLRPMPEPPTPAARELDDDIAF